MQRIFWILALILAPLIPAQTRLTFDVASIKPSKPGVLGGFIKPMAAGQGYIASGVPVRQMMSVMYRIPVSRITGGPGWLDSDLWEVEAKADKAYGTGDLHIMFQNLLAVEFKLKFHKENKEGQVYVLTVDKAGPKMKVNDSPQDFEVPIKGAIDGTTIGTRVPMEYLCFWLGSIPLRLEERPVIDKTGLTGNYDFTLSFLPELPPGIDQGNLPPGILDRPTIFDALKQQLGLKLEPQRGPVEYYVIDHVEKPAGN
jgi:uncharacterized protein (TIGR03435 family)